MRTDTPVRVADAEARSLEDTGHRMLGPRWLDKKEGEIMKTVLLSSIGLLCLIAGCASSSAVKTRAVELPPPLASSNTDETAREFHIPASDAPTALSVFSRQADRQVLFDYVVLRDRQTRAVDGVLTPSGALETMLSGSGLIAEVVNERTLAITPDRSGHSKL
jgi:hypothetical protein